MNASKKFYIYYETDLPKDGWFQSCIGCDIITSKTIFYKLINVINQPQIEIYNYLCETCKKKISNKEFFESYCNNSDKLLEINNNIIDPSNQVHLPP
mgnify:CR=1 FL=1